MMLTWLGPATIDRYRLGLLIIATQHQQSLPLGYVVCPGSALVVANQENYCTRITRREGKSQPRPYCSALLLVYYPKNIQSFFYLSFIILIRNSSLLFIGLLGLEVIT